MPVPLFNKWPRVKREGRPFVEHYMLGTVPGTLQTLPYFNP